MSYVNEIAELFISLNPQLQILHAEDYSIIAEWEKEDIPLSLVQGSITSICRKLVAEKVEIDSLVCLRKVVKEDFADWLKTSAVPA